MNEIVGAADAGSGTIHKWKSRKGMLTGYLALCGMNFTTVVNQDASGKHCKRCFNSKEPPND